MSVVRRLHLSILETCSILLLTFSSLFSTCVALAQEKNLYAVKQVFQNQFDLEYVHGRHMMMLSRPDVVAPWRILISDPEHAQRGELIAEGRLVEHARFVDQLHHSQIGGVLNGMREVIQRYDQYYAAVDIIGPSGGLTTGVALLIEIDIFIPNTDAPSLTPLQMRLLWPVQIGMDRTKAIEQAQSRANLYREQSIVEAAPPRCEGVPEHLLQRCLGCETQLILCQTNAYLRAAEAYQDASRETAGILVAAVGAAAVCAIYTFGVGGLICGVVGVGIAAVYGWWSLHNIGEQLKNDLDVCERAFNACFPPSLMERPLAIKLLPR